MKKKVNEIEKYNSKCEKVDRVLSIIALSSLLTSVSLSVFGVIDNQTKKELSKSPITPEVSSSALSENVNLTNDEKAMDENIFTMPVIPEQESLQGGLEQNINDTEIIVPNVEYEEVRIKVTINHVYELPTGFILKKDAMGKLIGVKTLNKVVGHEDYVKQFYPEEEGYKILDHGAYYEIRITPVEMISYSVPEGYDLIETETGYYGVKYIAKPITKTLS